MVMVDLPTTPSQGTVGHVRELLDCYLGTFISLGTVIRVRLHRATEQRLRKWDSDMEHFLIRQIFIRFRVWVDNIRKKRRCWKEIFNISIVDDRSS